MRDKGKACEIVGEYGGRKALVARRYSLPDD